MYFKLNKRNISFAALFIIIIGILPYRTTIVPSMVIKVIDESGSPIKKNLVKQYWRNAELDYSTDFANFELAETDGNGFVRFPDRFVTASFFHRLSTHIYILYKEGFWPGILPNSYIRAFGQDTDNPYIWGEAVYYDGKTIPNQIVIKEQKDPSWPQ